MKMCMSLLSFFSVVLIFSQINGMMPQDSYHSYLNKHLHSLESEQTPAENPNVLSEHVQRIAELNEESKQNAEKIYPTSTEIETMLEFLHSKIKHGNFIPDILVGLPRGALVALGYLSGEKYFDNRNVELIHVASYEGQEQKKAKLLRPINFEYLKNYKKILIVEDLLDSGKTMKLVLKQLRRNIPDADIKIAAIYYKKGSCIVPDYFADTTDKDTWVVFPWEALR